MYVCMHGMACISRDGAFGLMRGMYAISKGCHLRHLVNLI